MYNVYTGKADLECRNFFRSPNCNNLLEIWKARSNINLRKDCFSYRIANT